MDLSGQASQARFASYVEALVEVIGHADRAEPLHDYCVGLLMPGERKSVEPMAAIVAPARVSAKHQSLLHLVGQAPWPDEAVLQKIRELVLPGIERQGRIEAWIVDDTALRRRARIRSASRDNIVGGSANRTIVKSRLRCRSPIIRRACRSLTGSICRRHGQMMRHGGKRRMCRRMSGSKPSRRSRSIRSAQPMRQVSFPVSSWPMRAMVQTVTSAPVSVL